MSQAVSKPRVERDAVVIVGVITLGAFVSLFNQTVMAPALPARSCASSRSRPAPLNG